MNSKQQRSRNRNKNKNSFQDKPKDNGLLASAAIKHGLDTDILAEDLHSEYEGDPQNSDDSRLVNQKWVRFFDQRSSFLKSMMASLSNSTTLGNVINQKVSMTMGNGFTPYKSDSKNIPILEIFRSMLKKLTVGENGVDDMNTIIGDVNLNHETLEEVILKVSTDWWAFGNAMVELVKTTRDKKPVVYIYHIPLHKAAIHKANSNNIIKSIGVADNWDVITGTDTEVREIPIYPDFSTKATGDFEGERSAIHIKNYFPGFFYWGLPSNIASRFWAEIEYRIPKYNITKFKNGFVPSAILQFFGSLSKTEAKKMVANIEGCFTDTGKNNKMLIQILSDEKYKLDATILEDSSDGNYMDLSKLASQGIITGNNWTMSLAGFATGGKLGSNQQIISEFEFVTNTVIVPGRRVIVDKIVSPFIKESAIANPSIKNIGLKISNMKPISLASRIDPNKTLLNNELRSELGYDGLDEEADAKLNAEQGKGSSDPETQAA